MLSGFFSSVFWGVIVLSILVFVHEGGHFLAARLFGMRVSEFFLGMPSRHRLSFKSRKYGTEFGVTPILLGGYNRISGMEGTDDELLPQALAFVQKQGRISADELANHLSIDADHAFELLITLVDMCSIQPYYDPQKGEHRWQGTWPEQYQTLARDAHLLTEYDTGNDLEGAGATAAGEARPVEDAQNFFTSERARTYVGRPSWQRILTLLAGPAVNIITAYLIVMLSLIIVGIEVYSDTSTLGGVYEDSLAEAAGLAAGDRITELAGIKVSDWNTMSSAIDTAFEANEDFSITYERDGETFTTQVTMPEEGAPELFGVYSSTEIYHMGFIEANKYTLSYVAMVGSTVSKIIIPTHTIEVVSQSSSIVGISAMASEAASLGPNSLALFAAAISLSLGFMNLLPVPPLDGGKIVIEVVQIIIRRPLSTRMQNAVSYVGLAFFLFIFCFAIRNDIVRLLGL